MRALPLLLLFLSNSAIANAQSTYPWELGAGIGAGVYHGDLHRIQPGLGFLETHPSASIFFRHPLSNHLTARLGMLYTHISGSDRQSPERGFSFESPLFEWSLQGQIYPLGQYKKGKRKKSNAKPRMVLPFVSLGIAEVLTKPVIDWNQSENYGGVPLDFIQTDETEAQKFTLAFPVGAGVHFRLNDRIGLGLEMALRFAPSDYLDGVSVAGNPDNNDKFFTGQISAAYRFGTQRAAHPDREHSKGQESTAADSDGDGVADEKDECPEIAGMRGLAGCPDGDHDGIADKNDLCPEQPGLSATNGCPDADEDGIPDQEDNCPELKGTTEYRGCPAIDRDKDGVADAEDLCPDMSGQLKWKGCPDSDNDGLADNKDGCPGIAGPEHLRGCPDTDEDGIADKEDECPTIPGLPAKKGCPEALPPSPGVPYKAVYFNSTLEDWQVTSLITIDEIVILLQADPLLYARIEGHTDNTGKEPANDLLAEKRAKKLLDHLVSRGVAAEKLNYIGFGSKKPTVPNDTREHRQLNRRVEVHFYKKQ